MYLVGFWFWFRGSSGLRFRRTLHVFSKAFFSFPVRRAYPAPPTHIRRRGQKQQFSFPILVLYMLSVHDEECEGATECTRVLVKREWTLPIGLEPMALWLTATRSTRLSYGSGNDT